MTYIRGDVGRLVGRLVGLQNILKILEISVEGFYATGGGFGGAFCLYDEKVKEEEEEM